MILLLHFFSIIKFFFPSSVLWDTLLLFKLSSPNLKRKLRRKLKGKRTIPSWVLTWYPCSWIMFSTIMMHKFLAISTSFILHQLQSTHERINSSPERVILCPWVVVDFQLESFERSSLSLHSFYLTYFKFQQNPLPYHNRLLQLWWYSYSIYWSWLLLYRYRNIILYLSSRLQCYHRRRS